MSVDKGVVLAVGVVAIFVLPGLLSALRAFLKHREEMARLRANSTENSSRQLLARVDALEKKCAALQEQVNDAHALIHDEQRVLDRRLAEKLEGSAAFGTGGEAKGAGERTSLRV